MAARKAAKKTAGKKTSKAAARRKTVRKAASRKKIAPAKERRGLEAAEVRVGFDHPELSPLATSVEQAGGAPIGAYLEPLSGRPLLLAVLPWGAVEPTPFQRDLSPTHTKRLAAKIEESGSFLDPLIVVRGTEGGFWTPNGRHRLAAAKVLGLKQITCLISPDEDLAFKILALNTEKAHNLKDRSLEAIRMARALAERNPRSKETEWEAEFEAAELLTLGIIYEQEGRFAGGAYSPFLKKIDRFTDKKTLPKSLAAREGYAARLLEIDARVKEIVKSLQERGFKSPYLRNYVVARINPVRFHRAKRGDTAAAMELGAALTRMSASARKFDTQSVRERDLALVAAVSSD
jgi:ParB family chromosome partitioning protein